MHERPGEPVQGGGGGGGWEGGGGGEDQMGWYEALSRQMWVAW